MGLVGFGDFLLRFGIVSGQQCPPFKPLAMLLEGRLILFAERLSGGLSRDDPLGLLQPVGFLAVAMGAVKDQRTEEDRSQAALRLRPKFAKREQEDGGKPVDQQDIPPPQQHECVGQAEQAQPQVAAKMDVGDLDRSIGSHRAARHDHDARAEQQFQQASLCSLHEGPGK